MKITGTSRSELIIKAVVEHNIPFEEAPGKVDRAIERKRRELEAKTNQSMLKNIRTLS